MNNVNIQKTYVAVIGAGVSGLTLGVALKQKGVDTLVLESTGRLGGSIESVKESGYLCEMGPNTLMLGSKVVSDFLERRGLLQSALTAGDSARKRFIVHEGKLLALPGSPLEAVTSPFLSLKGKIKIFGDIFARPNIDPNESVAGFFNRHFGDELTTELVGPFVSGVYAGDPHRLVMRHAFPSLWKIGRESGSIVRGIFQKKRIPKGERVQRRLISWENGLAALIGSLSGELAGSILTGFGEITIQKDGAKGYLILSPQGSVSAEKIVFTTPVPTTQKILAPLLDSPAKNLSSIPYVPMVAVHLGFDREQIAHALDGFGVLIRRGLGIRILGTLFSSSLFPGRAPEGKVLLTVFIGGRLDQDIMDLSDDEIRKIVLKELSGLLQIKGSEEFVKIKRWAKAIPQYEDDYDRFLSSIEGLEKSYSGLHFSGNAVGGISVPNCIENNLRLAEKLFLEGAV